MKSRRIWSLFLFLYLGLVSDATAQVTEFTSLLSFAGTNGSEPWSRLVQATDGLLYGTTSSGGTNSNAGTIFRMTLSGDLTTLHVFDFANGGYSPLNGLLQANDGNFYGTAAYGGIQSPDYPYSGSSYGTIYRMTPSGDFTNLYQFSGADGANPWAGPLVQGRDGFLYDTTSAGGLTEYWGTVYQISTNGLFNSLFGLYSDEGNIPYGGLVEGSDGNFYGTTSEGGNRFGIAFGTVFKVTPSGAFTKLFSFNGQNGGHPFGGLVQASDGNFYGATEQGGSSYGDSNSVNSEGFGTLFRMTTNGELTTLVEFYRTNGAYPYGPLVQGSDGCLYGTTFSGGANTNFLFNDPTYTGYGTLFRMTTNGEFTTLFSFDGTNGAGAFATPMQANDGSFYGTTELGGAFNLGTAYRFTVPLPPTIGAINVSTDECGFPSGIFSDVITNYSGTPLAILWDVGQVTNLVPPAQKTIAHFRQAGVLPTLPTSETIAHFQLPGELRPGTNTVTLSVNYGTNVVSASTTVFVPPPVITSATANPSVLWPPSGQMVNVRVTATLQDSCQSATSKIISVESPGLPSGRNGKSTFWRITGTNTVSLRAERRAGGRDRIYQIKIQATDLSGDKSAPYVVTVTVPKQRPSGR